MEKHTIFLSYRRQDIPGYVGRLADHLEIAFGEPVFRDVDSIGAGTDWKSVLNQAVSDAKLILAVIGERWQEVLADKAGSEVDYVRFELNLARLLDKPVIPIALQGAAFDTNMDMGDLNWLKELQFFELSDRQNRWESDMEHLEKQITALSGLCSITQQDRITQSSSKVTEQTSHGDQSPNVVAGKDVSISFGDKPR